MGIHNNISSEYDIVVSEWKKNDICKFPQVQVISNM